MAIDWNKAQEYNATTTSLPPEQLVALIAETQRNLNVTQDGMFGPQTRLALAREWAETEERTLEQMIAAAIAQTGKPYIFGAEVRLDDPSPPAFDCSELVQWTCAQARLRMPDGTWNQVTHCRDVGTLIDVSTAIWTRGALLFKFGGDPFQGSRPSSAHVAISLGNGTTIEARSAKYPVGSFSAEGRGWTHAGLIPA